MDKTHINLSVPAQVTPIVDGKFTELFENEHVTKCKLKVFYIGETGDGRVFTKDFSEKLLTSLPYTPVIGYYDDEADDFKAHSDRQYMFGHVPVDASISFEEIDGNTYAVTDIILFTERHDIGEIAKKVIGSKHSLELNPNTVEYKITRDEKGKMTSLVFTNGDFYGLSIVGDAEKPAFEGSEFFKQLPDQERNSFSQSLMSFIETIKNYYSNEGGVEMDKFLEQLVENLSPAMAEFIKQTYAEQQEAVYAALYEAYGDYSCYIAQMDDSTVVYYSFEEGKYMRANYSSSEEGVQLGEAEEVKARFLTPDEIESTFTQKPVEGSEEDNNDEEEVTESNEEENFTSDVSTEQEEAPSTDEGNNDFQEEQHEENDDNDSEEESTDNDEASFTEGEEETEEEKAERERAEQDARDLKEFRRLAKLEVINNYQKFLDKEDFNKFKENVDEFSKDNLEQELKIKAADFLIASQQNDDNESVASNVFSVLGNNDELKKDESSIDFLVNKYKNKN